MTLYSYKDILLLIINMLLKSLIIFVIFSNFCYAFTKPSILNLKCNDYLDSLNTNNKIVNNCKNSNFKIIKLTKNFNKNSNYKIIKLTKIFIYKFTVTSISYIAYISAYIFVCNLLKHI